MPSNDFSIWLSQEMETRGWTNSELARRSDVVPSTISMLASGQKKPSAETCVNIARAMDYPPAQVLRLAGIMPPVTRAAENEETLLFIFRQLDKTLQEAVIDMLQGLFENRKSRRS